MADDLTHRLRSEAYKLPPGPVMIDSGERIAMLMQEAADELTAASLFEQTSNKLGSDIIGMRLMLRPAPDTTPEDPGLAVKLAEAEAEAKRLKNLLADREKSIAELQGQLHEQGQDMAAKLATAVSHGESLEAQLSDTITVLQDTLAKRDQAVSDATMLRRAVADAVRRMRSAGFDDLRHGDAFGPSALGEMVERVLRSVEAGQRMRKAQEQVRSAARAFEAAGERLRGMNLGAGSTVNIYLSPDFDPPMVARDESEDRDGLTDAAVMEIAEDALPLGYSLLIERTEAGRGFCWTNGIAKGEGAATIGDMIEAAWEDCIERRYGDGKHAVYWRLFETYARAVGLNPFELDAGQADAQVSHLHSDMRELLWLRALWGRTVRLGGIAMAQQIGEDDKFVLFKALKAGEKSRSAGGTAPGFVVSELVAEVEHLRGELARAQEARDHAP